MLKKKKKRDSCGPFPENFYHKVLIYNVEIDCLRLQLPIMSKFCYRRDESEQ